MKKTKNNKYGSLGIQAANFSSLIPSIMLIDSFIIRIYLYDDRLVITFNHKDDTETIVLEDIKTAPAEAGFGSDLVSFTVP